MDASKCGSIRVRCCYRWNLQFRAAIRKIEDVNHTKELRMVDRKAPCKLHVLLAWRRRLRWGCQCSQCHDPRLTAQDWRWWDWPHFSHRKNAMGFQEERGQFGRIRSILGILNLRIRIHTPKFIRRNPAYRLPKLDCTLSSKSWSSERDHRRLSV